MNYVKTIIIDAPSSGIDIILFATLTVGIILFFVGVAMAGFAEDVGKVIGSILAIAGSLCLFAGLLVSIHFVMKRNDRFIERVEEETGLRVTEHGNDEYILRDGDKIKYKCTKSYKNGVYYIDVFNYNRKENDHERNR